MKCTICNKTVNDVPLYRNNPKGEKGDWRCYNHLSEEKKMEHSSGGFKEITETIHKAGNQ